MSIIQVVIGSQGGSGINDLPAPNSGTYQSSIGITPLSQNGTPFNPGSAQSSVNNSNGGLWRRKYEGNFNSGVGGTPDINFFNNNTQLFARQDLYVSFGNQSSVTPTHSFEWLGYVQAPGSGTYNFVFETDDDGLMWIGTNAISGYTQANALMIGSNSEAVNNNSVILTSGLWYPVRLWMTDWGGLEKFQLYFGAVSTIPTSMSNHTLVYDTTTTGLNASSYSVVPASGSVDEGSSINFTITTTGIQDGTTLYWSNVGTAAANRFSDSTNSGSFTVTNNSATITRSPIANNHTDGSTTIVLEILIGSIYGTVVATASSVTVNDTSLSPPVPGSAVFNGGTSYLTIGSGGTHNITPTSDNFNAIIHSPPAPSSAGSMFYFNNTNTPIQSGWTFTADSTLCTVTYLNILPFGPGYPNYSQCEFYPRITASSITANSTVAMNVPQPWGTLGNTWTIEWWSKAATATDGSTVYTVMSQGAGVAGIDIYYYNAAIWVGKGSDIYSTANEPASSIWTHVALVANAGTLSLYYNGVPQSITPWGSTLNDSSGIMTIGRRGISGGAYFNGKLTNIRINNTAVYSSTFYPPVTPANISGTIFLYEPTDQALATDTSSSPQIITNNSVTYSSDYPVVPLLPLLPFDLQTAPSSGTIWTDVVNGINGTITGTATYVSDHSGGIQINGSGYIIVPGYVNTNTFTMSMASNFQPTAYWSTAWGSENYDNNSGYAAIFNDSQHMTLGPIQTGGASISIPDVITTIGLAWWDFVFDGTTAYIYKNGTLYQSKAYTSPSSANSSSPLIIGGRHQNGGGLPPVDKMTGTYYRVKYVTTALNSSDITTQYNSVKSTYGLP